MRISDWSSDVCSSDLSIIQDILGMARRERAQPEPVELVGWAQRFMIEFRSTRAQGDEHIRVSTRLTQLDALIDPGHLHQIVTVLINNAIRSEEHTSELQSLMRISYAVFCLKKTSTNNHT